MYPKCLSCLPPKSVYHVCRLKACFGGAGGAHGGCRPKAGRRPNTREEGTHNKKTHPPSHKHPLYVPPHPFLSLSLSLTHTHTHTHTEAQRRPHPRQKGVLRAAVEIHQSKTDSGLGFRNFQGKRFKTYLSWQPPCAQAAPPNTTFQAADMINKTKPRITQGTSVCAPTHLPSRTITFQSSDYVQGNKMQKHGLRGKCAGA